MLKKLLTISLLLLTITTVTPARALELPLGYFVPIVLKDNLNQPITTAQNVRISLWSRIEVKNGDVQGNGNINTSLPHYGGYQTEITITPDGDGYFVPIVYGLYNVQPENLAGFPANIGTQNAYLQVDFKNTSAPNSDYVTYDFSNGSNPATTRHLLDESLITDTLNTGGGTNEETFVLDSNDSSTSEITLQFGDTLAEAISWNITNVSFDFTGPTLILDSDNTGAGEDVTIVANQGSDNDGAIRYNAATNQWEISNDGGTFTAIASGLISELAGVQARRTSSYTLTTSFANVTLDITDIETKPNVLEHNDTSTERIDIKEDGLYLIRYNAAGGGSATSTHLTTARVMQNDTTELPGSRTVNRNYQQEYSSNTANFIAQLSAGDYVTLQLQRDSVTDITQEDITFSVVKLEGVQGAQGPQGPQGLPGSVGAGTDSAVFTLDQENTGSAADVDIVANQGTDNDGTLRYSAANQRWEISNNGGAFEAISTGASSASVAQVYESGTTTFNALTPIDWDGTSSVVRVVDATYTHSTSTNPSRVTINESGLYEISYNIAWDTTANSNRNASCALQVNGTPASPAVGSSHSVAINNTNDWSSNAAASFLYSFTAGDYYEITCESTGSTGSMTTLANQSWTTIKKIR